MASATDIHTQGAVEMARYWLRHPERMTEAGFERVCRELYTVSRALVRLAADTDTSKEPKA